MADVTSQGWFPRSRAMAGRLGDWLGHRAIPPMAAALAYRTVFSIIPLCVIAIVVLQSFVNKRSVVQDLFGKFMDLIGLGQIGLDEDQNSAVAGKLQEIAGHFDKVSFTGIGIISGLTLVYAAISLLIELETAFNRLYNAPRGRSVVRRLMQYWLLISLGPVLIAASFAVAERLTGITAGVESVATGWLLSVVAFISSVAISTMTLWVLYITIPNTRVRFMPALYGALVGSVALEAAKYGFHIYLERAALKSLYGSLALVPMFLLWVYLTWLIVLTGLRVSYLIQQGRRLRILHLSAGLRSKAAFFDPAYAVAVACEVGRAFARGESVTAEQIAERTGVTDEAARELLGRLKGQGVVLPVQTPGSDLERFVLARPAETVQTESVLAAGFEAAGSGAAPAVEALRAAQVKAVKGRTLADELGQIGGVPGGAAPQTPAASVVEAVAPVPVRATAAEGV
ncbi:MAG: YihY/virulence factor BrkB family protein [Phycisphaerales bacterium]